ncbi:alpha/beta fold hydrolase [Streptomyces sp. NPDC014006]|uniref:alpha/beta fold hydrolase n=1 Tax=Streptomyces sp. NPDC014006 TaxID=3364870 RepID=UPI0036F77647
MSSPFTVVAADTRLYGVDSRLYGLDSSDETPPLLFLNGAFATRRQWSRVLQRLVGRYRTVTFDARARGKSGRSSDCSIRADIDDIDRVVEATGIRRPILVGRSYGATLAVCYAAEYPGQVGGLVLVDGAHPVSLLDQADQEKLRSRFSRRGRIERILAPLGLSARMTPVQRAEVVIEMDIVNGELSADLAALRCPTVFVADDQGTLAASEHHTGPRRAAVAKAVAANPHLSLFPASLRDHRKILSTDPGVVVAAIGEVVRRSEWVSHR